MIWAIDLDDYSNTLLDVISSADLCSGGSGDASIYQCVPIEDIRWWTPENSGPDVQVLVWILLRDSNIRYYSPRVNVASPLHSSTATILSATPTIQDTRAVVRLGTAVPAQSTALVRCAWITGRIRKVY